MASCSCSTPLFCLGQGRAKGATLEGRRWSSCSSVSSNLPSRQLLHVVRRTQRVATRDVRREHLELGGGGRRATAGAVLCNIREIEGDDPVAGGSRGIQLYSQIERLITETARQAQDSAGTSEDWEEIEGSYVLKPKDSDPVAVVHFIGGIFVGAAPQITYRLFLQLLADKGILVIATPFASGFDHLVIADEAQFKFDRCLRSLKDTVSGLPTFGIGHSLGSLIHLLIGSRYAIQRDGNILMAFNNKEASSSIPLFSPVIVPMAQSFGPIISQLTSSPAVVRGAEIALKQLENINPRIMKQVLPLVEQLPPLYMDLARGRDDFVPKPDETRRLIKSYYGVSRNLLIRFKEDDIDETGTLAQVLSSESAVSSQLDMSIRTLPGDHAFPLQQVLPNVPPAMAETVNRGSEFLAGLTAGTPWEAVAKEMGSTFGADSMAIRSKPSKEMVALVDSIAAWIISSSSSSSGPGSRLLLS